MESRTETLDSSISQHARAEIDTSPEQFRNLNTRLDEATYLKFKTVAKRLGAKTNEEALRLLLNTQEKVPVAQADTTQPSLERDELSSLRKRLAASTDQELILRLKARLDKTEAKALSGVFLSQQFARGDIALAKLLLPCIRKLQSQLKSEGYDHHLSTAVNLAIVYLVVHTPQFKMEAGELEILRAYMQFGPMALNPNIVKRFLNAEVTFKESQTEEEEQED